MDRSTAWRKSLAPVGALGALLLLAVFGIPVLFLVSLNEMAGSQNDYARAMQGRQVDSLERYMLKDFLRNALDYSHWDDAYQQLVAATERQWFQDNVGVSSYGSSLQDAVVLVTPDGAPLVGSWKDAERDWTPDTVIGPVFRRLFTTARASAGVEAVGAYARAAGAPAIVAVAPVTRFDGGEAAGRRYLVFIRFLSGDTIAAFRDMMGQPGLDVALKENPEQFSRPLLDDAGAPVAWLTWPADAPGSVALQNTLPKVAFAIVLFVVVAAVLIRRSQHAAKALTASEARSRHLSTTDPLTGLPNRRSFHEAVHARLASALGGIVFLVDLDGFKEINDTFGHDIGDMVLRQQAERLRRLTDGRGLAARLGGDEFAMLVGRPDDPVSFGEEALAAICAPIDIAGTRVAVGGSIGFQAVEPDLAADEIIRRADTAMYAAKDDGGRRIVAYEPKMERDRDFRRALEDGIKAGLDAGDFFVVYQPIVASGSGEVIGVEALARWRDPESGDIPPSLFVPVAEESNLIIQLGEFVLRRACAEAASWGDLRLSVNLSTVQLMDEGIVDRIATVLAETGFPASRLELEITESYLLRKPDRAAEVINRLRGLGISISLDDFGTGYASIGYIQRFPIDKIKLDRSFVQGIVHDQQAAQISSAVVGLGTALSVPIVAEGVEHEDQAILLRAAGCAMMQGYLYARPMPAASFGAWLGSRTAGRRSEARA